MSIPWRMHRQEQEYYTLPTLAAVNVTGPVVVPVTGWEASFDRGVTWSAAAAHPQQPTSPAWLLRGAGYPGAGDSGSPTGILITASVTPLVRLRDAPETAIESAPHIVIWG